MNLVNDYFVVGRGTTLALYRHDLTEESLPIITELNSLNLFKNIVKIHTSPSKFSLDQAAIPLLVEYIDGLSFIIVDVKVLKLTLKNDISLPSGMQAVSFISDKEAFVLDKKNELHYYLANSYKLQEKAKLNSQIDIGEG